MRVAILGGTFNPIHIGHLFLAEEILRGLGYDKILFIPTNLPAHKLHNDSVRPEHRLNMMKLCLTQTSFIWDDCEINRGGISYSIDTVNEIYHRYPVEGRLGFIMGDDLLAGFASWKNPRELVSKTDLIVVHRTSLKRFSFPFPHRYLDNLILPISSTDIRRRVKANEPFRYLVPEEVYGYILEKDLYRA